MIVKIASKMTKRSQGEAVLSSFINKLCLFMKLVKIGTDNKRPNSIKG